MTNFQPTLNHWTPPLNGASSPILHAPAKGPEMSRLNLGTHVLMPVRLEPRHRQDAVAALEWTACHRPGARVTLLHVVPPEPAASSVHWLDAIDYLHRALSERRWTSASALEHVRRDIAGWIERDVSAKVRAALTLHGECRVGEPAAEILRFAEETSVDLVMLCKQRSRWRWPLRASVSQRVLEQAHKPVLLMHSPLRRVGAVGAKC